MRKKKLKLKKISDGDGMLKVAVYDSGWGGELVADFLEEELAVVEVIRVIDWRRMPFAGKSRWELIELAEEDLRPFWGRVDVVVLGGWQISRVRRELLRRHPEQRIVGFDFGRIRTQTPVRRLIMLADEEVRRGEVCQMMLGQLRQEGMEVIEPECRGWTQLIDDGEMRIEQIEERLEPWVDGKKVDLAMVGNTHFWDIENELREVLEWQAAIYDWRWELLHRVCMALGLRGLDGRRLKGWRQCRG